MVHPRLSQQQWNRREGRRERNGAGAKDKEENIDVRVYFCLHLHLSLFSLYVFSMEIPWRELYMSLLTNANWNLFSPVRVRLKTESRHIATCVTFLLFVLYRLLHEFVLFYPAFSILALYLLSLFFAFLNFIKFPTLSPLLLFVAAGLFPFLLSSRLVFC
jgi:hypothetical protein